MGIVEWLKKKSTWFRGLPAIGSNGVGVALRYAEERKCVLPAGRAPETPCGDP